MPDDELEPSTELLREGLKSEYDKDFELKERLDKKASNMVTMAGVVAAIFTSFSGFVLNEAEAPNAWLLGISITALLIELALLVKTMHASIMAIKIAKYTHVLIWSKFVHNDKLNYAEISKWKQASKTEFNRQIIEDYIDASRKNTQLNEDKAKWLTEAQKAFLYAMILIPIAAVLAIVTRFAS